MSNRVSRLPLINGFSHLARSNCRNNSLLPTYAAASSGESPRLNCEYFIRSTKFKNSPFRIIVIGVLMRRRESK